MRLLIVLICCLGALAADQQADSTEVQTTNKLTAAKSSLNAIPSAPAQKTTLIQQSHQQYIPQYVVQKPVSIPVQQQQEQQQQQHYHSHAQQPAAAMYIIAQPSGHQSGSQNTLFQQAVQQLLSYYSNNPQARYQLLQQQGGSVPQHQQITHAHPIPQPAQHSQQTQAVQTVVQRVQPAHAAYHHHMPSGALHVIPSPHLDNSNLNQHSAQPQVHVQNHAQPAQTPQQTHQTHQTHQSSSTTNQPQAIYAIPASSQHTLSQISPGLLAQLTGHSTPQQQTVPFHFSGNNQYSQHLLAQASTQPDLFSQLGAHFGSGLGPNLGSHLSSQLQLGSQLGSQLGGHLGGQFYTQLPANFGSQFTAQLPAHYALPSQYQQAGYQHLQPQISVSQGQNSGAQPQFNLKQNTASSGNEYVAHVVQATQPAAQSEKSNQGQSSNYSPVYKTAYIKG